MSGFDSNVYYHPEKHGLSVVVEVEALGGYEFDTFVVWKDEKTGEYVWAADSGCSCPLPFEGVNPTTAARGTARDALNDLRVWAGEGWGDRRAREARSAIETLEGLQ